MSSGKSVLFHAAYGRRYTTSKAMLQDLLRGQDFSMSLQGGPYFSVRDLSELSKSFDSLRYLQAQPYLAVTLPIKDILMENPFQLTSISSHLPDLIDAYIAYRTQRLAKDREAAEIKELEEQVKDAIISKFREQGLTAMGANNGVVKMAKTVEPQGQDWLEIWKYIRETDQFDLLHKRLSSTAIKERWEAGEEIPGVGKQDVYKLTVSGTK
jgi:hypothetical protein